MLKNKKFLLLCLLALPPAGVAQQRIASGPVEVVNGKTSQVTVLGQTFSLTAATIFAVNGSTLSLAQGLEVLALNQSATIEGMDTASGAVATFVDLSPASYVPGASGVYVRGTISAFSRTDGLIRIGSLLIDATAVAPDTLAGLTVGSTIEAAGIQPSPVGRLVGPVELSVSRRRVELQSIGGTGVQLQSIGGTGLQKQSIGGTGVQLQSIGGTGLQKQSIGGTGVQLQSIGGTGLQKQSIGGTGIQLQSIGGTGLQKQSIGGTGVQSIR